MTQTKKEILIIAYGSGGSEIINLIHDKLPFNVKNINISEFAQNKNPNGIPMTLKDTMAVIKENKPFAVINERSNGLQSHYQIENLCRTLKIPTICLLDINGGYKERFPQIPTYILCPSETIKSDLVDFGCLEESLIVVGNPAFDSLWSLKYKDTVNRIAPKVLYISQGPNSYDTVMEIYKSLEKVFLEFSLDIKLHPQEDKDVKYDYRFYSNIEILDFDDSEDFLPSCLGYDLVLGTTSTLQLKTNLIGIPTLFINKEDNLEHSLELFKMGGSFKKPKYDDFPKNATNSTVEAIIHIINSLEQ